MITNEDKVKVKKLQWFLDNELGKLMNADPDKPQWEMIEWIDLLDKMVSNLEKAPHCYRPAEAGSEFFTAVCIKCEWWGSSEYLDGGGQIADTGDYSAACCPVCGCTEIDCPDNLPDNADCYTPDPEQ